MRLVHFKSGNVEEKILDPFTVFHTAHKTQRVVKKSSSRQKIVNLTTLGCQFDNF